MKSQLRFANNAANAIDSLPKLKDRQVSYDLGLIGSQASRYVREYQRQTNKSIAAFGFTNKNGVVAVPPGKLFEFQEEQELSLDVEVDYKRGPFKLEQIQPADEKNGGIEPWIFRALIDAGIIEEKAE